MLNAQIRSAIYVLTAIASPLVAYLGTTGRLDDFWVGLFAVLVTAVSGLAYSKVTPDGK